MIGCAANPALPPVKDKGAEPETLPMIALEVYRDESNFFVKYRYGSKVLYAGSNWQDRVELIDSPAPASPNYISPSLVPMQYHQETPWESLPNDAISMPVLGIEKWHLLRDRLLRSVVPGNGTGLVIDFVYDEYFLFYDSDGKFHATRLLDKPADYRVHANLRFDEFMHRGRPILDEFLKEQGIVQTELVFNTGDAGSYSLPFLYLNTERHLLVFIRNVPMRTATVNTVPGLKRIQAFGHVLQSHLINLIQRPVSSLYRLFFVVTDTAVSTLTLDWTGGMNIGREYRYDWHDLMMEIQGPVVDILGREFQLAWAHAGPLGDLGYFISRVKPIERHTSDQGYPLRVLLTSTGNYEIYNAQFEAIRRAQRYIYIQNAYFTDDTLLRELVLARRRGVDVRVIVPMETDHGPINRSNVLAANLMLKHGIRVFIYPGFSHVKASIYDGWVCVGSANFDRLSLRLNRELNISSSAPEVAEQLLERVFEPDFRSSPELTEPIPDRWIDHLVEIVGDYIY